MAPNTQLGKVILPNKLDSKEDRFNNPYFNRSVWFIEDLVSHNRLDFCNRYLNLPTYEEMYNDVKKYFTVIRNSARNPVVRDRNGKRQLCRVMKNKRQLCHIVDKNKYNYRRPLCLKTDKMPTMEFKEVSA